MRKALFYFVAFVLVCSCSHTAGEMDTYRNCGLEGDAKRQDVRSLNTLKNRYTFPDSADFDHSVTLHTMLAPGEDRERFSDRKAVDITGYVYDVKVGGDESCNCHERSPEFRDTHIELVLPMNLIEEKNCVIVEVTPRMREIMA